MNRIIVLVLALAACVAATAVPCDSVVSVSLLTCAPGSDIYELEGHTALRFRMADSTDITVHWGVFDFNAPAFVYRFVKGETDYMCGASDTERFLDSYDVASRDVFEQVLNLGPEGNKRLYEAVCTNLLPQNRVYRYNYVLDNCATRPLALIEDAAGVPVEIEEDYRESTTFRRMMREYHRNYPWYQFGIDLALGSGIDRPITRREEGFAPVTMMEIAGKARVNGHPLTSEAVRVVQGSAAGGPKPPTPWHLTPLAAGWAIFITGAAVIIIARRRHRMPRVLETIYYTIAGFAGLVLTFLIFISVHEATSPNWLYLWLNPLCLAGAILIWLKKCKQAVVWWQFINFAAIIALCVIAAAGVQSLNSAFWPLMALDLLLSVNRLTYRN